VSVGIRRSSGIEWYRFQSVRMAIEVSSMKKADTLQGRGPPESRHQQKNLFLRTDRARFRTNSVRSLRPVLPDLPCLLCLSFLSSGAPGCPTFPPQRPTRLLRPHPLLVPSPCIRPLILSSTGLLPTPCGCARPATISATLTPLAT